MHLPAFAGMTNYRLRAARRADALRQPRAAPRAQAEGLPIRWPNFCEREKMPEMGIRPASLCLETAERPAEAMQPHSVQTGRPPNWQGSIRVDRSAETHVVVCAK